MEENTSSQTNLVGTAEIGDDKTISPMPHSGTTGASEVGVSASNQENVYKMYKRRWIGMVVIIGLNIATAFVWLTFSAVSKISETWLNASLTEINLSSMLYFIGSIVTSNFSGFVFEKWGIKVAVSLAYEN